MNIQKAIAFMGDCTIHATQKFLIGLGMFVVLIVILVGQVILDCHITETTKNIQTTIEVPQ